MLYSAQQNSIFKVPSRHDPDEVRAMGIILSPGVWTTGIVYGKQDDENYDVVIPTTFTGLYYKVKNPGKSGATEPTWVTTPGEETIDGTTGLVWEAALYNLMPVAETLTTATVTATNGVILSGVSNTTTTCSFTITAIGSTAAARTLGVFEVTAVLTKSNSEVVNCTLKFKLGEH